MIAPDQLRFCPGLTYFRVDFVKHIRQYVVYPAEIIYFCH